MTRRRASRPNAVPAITTVAILLLLGVLYACQQVTGIDVGLSGTDTPPPPTAMSGTATSSSWYHLYFTTPTNPDNPANHVGGIPEKVAASFATAQKTIDVAIYEFDLTSLSEALIRAAQRGVRVRLVTDTDSLEEQPVKDLIAADIPVVDDRRSAIMHDKFAVIDGATVWTGSMNFTDNDAYRNDNNFIEITSPRLAQNYTIEFEEMFTRREFGPTSTADTPNPTVTINGLLFENYFSPDDGVADYILDVLKSARSNIYFMAFSFTRTDFADVLIDKAKAGQTVQGVFETRQIAAGGDQAWNALTAAGLDVRQDGNSYTMHNKVIIVDQQVVITGSYNFSKSAEDSNDENVLIIHSPEIAGAYLEAWQRVWAQARR